MSSWRDRGKRLAEVAFEAVVFFALYWLFAGQMNWGEVVVGVAATSMAIVASHLVGARLGARFWGNVRWILQAWRLVGMTLSGTFAILKVLAKHLAGDEPAKSLVRAVRYEATGDEDASQMEIALATAYTTISPNFVVFDVDLERHLLLYHQIDPSAVPTLTQKLGARP